MSEKMNRLKLRAWLPRYKLMCNVIYIDFDNSELGVYLTNDCSEGDMSIFSFDEVEIMQYTCYIDTNKNEAYDQDIVKVFDGDAVVGIGVITWCRGAWYTQSITDGGEGLDIDLDATNWHGFEIIGNKFQNPELLELSE